MKILRLPLTEGWPNRVIMLKNQRFSYDQAIRMVGTHIVEIETMADLDAALTEPVAMIAVLGTQEAESKVRLEDLVARARPRGIPVMVDAASEHIERPSSYLVRGADMVIYSGGKFLRGPQTSGLLLGRKDLIQAAWRNASPHQGSARGMKVSKEDVIGVLAALEVWFEHRDPAVELARWNADVATIAGRLDLPGVSTRSFAPKGVVRVPRLIRALGRGEIRIGRRGGAPASARGRSARDAGRHGDHGELGRGRSVRVAGRRGGPGRPRACGRAVGAGGCEGGCRRCRSWMSPASGMFRCPSCMASGRIG